MEKLKTQSDKIYVAQKSERLYGLDLLRIVSMLMIVTLHILKHGGILEAAVPGTAVYFSANLLFALSSVAVNCFALISGFFGADSRKMRYSKLASLWISVVFYCFAIGLIYSFQYPWQFKSTVWIAMLFPVSSQKYWYFTAYFAVFLFSPFYNILINSLNKKQMRVFLVTSAVLFSLVSTVWQADLFKLHNGYSFIWLSLLYVTGGILKRLEWHKRINIPLAAGGFILLGAAAAGFKYLADVYAFTQNSELLYSYVSPTILTASLLLFLIFAEIKVNSEAVRKIIGFIAPSAFFVYIIHTNTYIWGYELTNRFAGYAKLHPAAFPFAVIGTALAVYLCCTAVDLIRRGLFRVIQLDKALNKLENKIRRQN